jgi:choline-sulfatase
MVDQLNAGFLGCSGHPSAETPNIDALAARGTMFAHAYTPSPICVSARAAFATGCRVNDIGAWDNAHPYAGQPPSWAHLARNAGHRAVSVGKLHYRSETDDTGFEQIAPLHVVDGVGDLKGLLRDPLPEGKKRSKLVERLGPGETGYTRYDREIADRAADWIKAEGASGDKPWVLFVSFYCPHHPYSAPEDDFAVFADMDVALPKRGVEEHPWIAALNRTRNDDSFFEDETRRLAIRNYLGLCRFVDARVGDVLSALNAAGLSETTRIMFTADHGESLGARGVWQKYNLYEEAARVPLILAGPEVPSGKLCRTPASLVDVFPSVTQCLGLSEGVGDRAPDAQSLWQLASADDTPRTVFSEYHGSGSPSAAFMLMRWPWKYIHYTGFEPELFNLAEDPEEMANLAKDPNQSERLSEFEAELRSQLDPEAVDRRAKDDQAAMVAAHGGRDVVERRGWLQGTPPPGESAEFMN